MSQVITLVDVSKEANVSLNTAAKVLAGNAKKARISDKTAKKILKIADKLGYTPNIMARNLRAKKTGIIGVCVADMTDTTYTLVTHSQHTGYKFVSYAKRTPKDTPRDIFKGGEIKKLLQVKYLQEFKLMGSTGLEPVTPCL